MSAQRAFSWKAFVSFYVVFSFLALATSGIVLYVAPPGRVANWSVWRLLLLSKAQWQAVHTIVALIFLVAASFHIYFNWKVLVAYVKSKLHAGVRMKRELAAASIAGVVILTAAIAAIRPFSAVMNLGEDVKNSWSTASTEPPVPHAELMTVEKLADTVKLTADTVIDNLGKNGVKGAEPGKTFQQIADENDLTPQQVYQKGLGAATKSRAGMAEGGGWGRMTVQQVCERYGVSAETGVARLQAAGIEAESSTPVRDIATTQGKTPIEIAKAIAGDAAAVSTPGTHTPRERSPLGWSQPGEAVHAVHAVPPSRRGPVAHGDSSLGASRNPSANRTSA